MTRALRMKWNFWNEAKFFQVQNLEGQVKKFDYFVNHKSNLEGSENRKFSRKMTKKGKETTQKKNVEQKKTFFFFSASLKKKS